MNAVRAALCLFLALQIAGCANGPGPKDLGGAPEITVLPAREMPAPDGSTSPDHPYTFVIGPFDKLVVDVFGIQELNARRFTVDGSGNISLPLGGQVSLAGLTLQQARDRIAQSLRAAHVRQPEVSVNLEDAASSYVTVDGSVKVPGNYPVISNMTLMRAVAAAQGVTEFAKLDDVVIFRTVNGKKMIALYRLSYIRRGAYADPAVYPHDTIVVGDSPGRRLFNQFLQIAPALASPLVALVRL